MSNKPGKFFIPLATFIFGVFFADRFNLSIILLISLLVLFGIPITIIGIVIYQRVFLNFEWRPYCGKAFLALLLWFFPSFFVAISNLIYWTKDKPDDIFYHMETTMFGHFILFILLSIYGLTGIGLSLWVWRPKISSHWLLQGE